MFAISRKSRAVRASNRHEDKTRPRSGVRRGVAPLLAVVVAASGLAASPAQAADPWIGLEAFAPEPMTVARTLAPITSTNVATQSAINGTLDNTTFALGLPQPSIASFVLIGKVAAVERNPATGAIWKWKIGTGPEAKWVYNRAGTRLDNAPGPNQRVKVLANRLTTAGPAVNAGKRALVAERITRKSLTAADGAPEVEINYLFTGALQSAPEAPVWTVTQGTSSVDVDVSGTATGEEVLEPGFEPALGDQVTVQFVPAGTVFEAD